MKSEIEQIRAYTRSHPELLSAHHFLFDLPLTRDISNVDYVVMGINPGEAKNDDGKGPTEETSERDFHEVSGKSRREIAWTQKCFDMLGTESIVQTELFFWSTRNLNELITRFGVLDSSNPHLAFCTRMNKRLIDHYQPKAVICPGLHQIPIATQQYGLTFRESQFCPDKRTHRLLEAFEDGKRPWVFTKHWSGSRYFTSEQKSAIARYLTNF